MPAENLLLPKKVKRGINKFPPRIQDRIIHSLITLKENPILGMKLKGELGTYYKYRMGDYRIVYTFVEKTRTIVVVKIEHRQGVYK